MSSIESLPLNILARIFECYANERRALYSLAITCRTFSLVALKLLWRTLASPDPLFLTLSPEFSVVRCELLQAPSGLPCSSITRPPEPARPSCSSAELERFKFYASFVQCIDIPEQSSISHRNVSVTPDIWRILSRSRSAPLFPHLRRVGYRGSWPISIDDRGFIPLHIFLGPDLEELSIYLHNTSEDDTQYRLGSTSVAGVLRQLLVSLPLESPRTHTLRLTVGPFEDAQNHLALALRGLSCLTSFYLHDTPLGPKGIAALSSLPHLKNATFETRLADFTPDSMPNNTPLDAIHFPVLGRLQIQTDAIECALILLRWSAMDAPALMEIYIGVHPTLTVTHFTSLTTAISVLRCRHTLEVLDISNTPTASNLKDFPHQPPPIALPHSAISPLYILPEITRLCLDGSIYVSLTDAALAELAHAWPRLSSLFLLDSCAGPGGVTLAGLLDLTQHCPLLHNLSIPLAHVDRATCEKILARRPAEGCAPRLFCLGIGAPSVDDADVAVVAATMGLVFPSLNRVLDIVKSAEVRRRWQRIELALPVFRKVRQQERNYALGQARSLR